jgi:hypothetical protein
VARSWGFLRARPWFALPQRRRVFTLGTNSEGGHADDVHLHHLRRDRRWLRAQSCAGARSRPVLQRMQRARGAAGALQAGASADVRGDSHDRPVGAGSRNIGARRREQSHSLRRDRGRQTAAATGHNAPAWARHARELSNKFDGLSFPSDANAQENQSVRNSQNRGRASLRQNASLVKHPPATGAKVVEPSPREDFVCPSCRAHYKVVRVKSGLARHMCRCPARCIASQWPPPRAMTF